MTRYVAKRFAYMLVTLFVIASITFFISKLLPGTPFADDKLTPQIRAQLFAKYGLDEPLPVQYAKYMLNVAQGDLGNSFYFESRPVTQMILQDLPISMFVGVQAVVFGFVVNTVSAAIDVDAYLRLLAVDGTLVNVGAPPEPLSLDVFSLIGARRSFAGSMIGGIALTQEMLDFCAEHGIGAEVEVIPAAQVDEAYARVLASDVRYRFVIDAATLR